MTAWWRSLVRSKLESIARSEAGDTEISVGAIVGLSPGVNYFGPLVVVRHGLALGRRMDGASVEGG